MTTTIETKSKKKPDLYGFTIDAEGKSQIAASAYQHDDKKGFTAYINGQRYRFRFAKQQEGESV